MRKSVLSWLMSLSGDREQSLLGRQRFVIFIITAIAVITFNVLSLFYQPLTPVARIFAIVVSSLAADLIAAYFLGLLHLRANLTILLVIAQLQNVIELVTYAQVYTPELDIYIITDVMISILILMAALVSFLRYSPSVVAVLSLLSYARVIYVVDSELLSGLFVIYFFILAGVIIYDSLAVHTMLLIDEEKMNLTEEFTAFIKATGLSREDIKGYASLSRNLGASTEQARGILMSMRPWAQHNLISSVEAMLKEVDSDRVFLKKVFPTLTETQLSIVQLIIMGKKQKEICLRLGKTASNVSAQRSLIRSKLGLSSADNLRTCLLSAVQQYKNGTRL